MSQLLDCLPPRLADQNREQKAVVKGVSEILSGCIFECSYPCRFQFGACVNFGYPLIEKWSFFLANFDNFQKLWSKSAIWKSENWTCYSDFESYNI